MDPTGQVIVGTTRLADDLAVLTEQLGFRVESIFPADSPATAVVSGHGVTLRLERRGEPSPVAVLLPGDAEPATLPGGTTVEFRSTSTSFTVPDNAPTLVVSRNTNEAGVGRAGMRYRDLIPDRWGGRFVSSHISIPTAGPVPDYVHFHRVRFQMIFVKSGWVRVVYEDQGEPFVMHRGDAVLQPPEIRHRVLESSAGLEVIEIGSPAEHETAADWSTPLPTPFVDTDRDFGGQRFVRHVAADAAYRPWRVAGWEYRDTGIGEATGGLAGARVARPVEPAAAFGWTAHDTEFAQLVVLDGHVTIEIEGDGAHRLVDGDSVALPGGTVYRCTAASADCELLDVTLPAEFAVVTT